ncbi:PsiF family protein [Rhodopila sp.]|uniref:PsiF family protein n=1 Tax=Rhodopila sp. TaxID=2480087 RepID=UPI002BE0A5A2|nr:PsiF family protein [Rhodopila sp.]HVZ09169.1 PsiF family protein [Rhodopila sp.]
MKSVFLAAMLSVAMGSAWVATARADTTSCAATAADKKLAGAAKTSFMKKCTTDATAACTTQATDKKLAGAAKTSFMKKCVSDATGS